MSTVDLKRDVEGLLTEKVFFQNACIGYGGHLVSIHNYDELYQVACATHSDPQRSILLDWTQVVLCKDPSVLYVTDGNFVSPGISRGYYRWHWGHTISSTATATSP